MYAREFLLLKLKVVSAATAVYVCTEHTSSIINEYLENLKPIFQTIKECEEGRDVMDLLEGPIAHNGFKRLN